MGLRRSRWVLLCVCLVAVLIVTILVTRDRAPAPTPTPTVPAAPGTTTSGSGAATSASAARDRFRHPFVATSFWNMPVGDAARYRPLALTAPSYGYGVDVAYLQFAPTAPLRQLKDRDYWWPWRDGERVVGAETGVSVRVPDTWIVPPPPKSELPNRASAALQADGLVREFQYTVRPKAGSDISMYEEPRGTIDLAGDGTMASGVLGGHGGSGMTGVGGTIRVGELTGSEPIRHALALTMNMRKWGVQDGSGIRAGYRWPATAADRDYADRGFASGYGTITTNGGGGRAGVGMGSLLAIPGDVDLDALQFETPQGAKLAWTHQNHGAYVVDNSEDDGDHDIQLLNVEAGVVDEFPQLETSPDTPFGRDLTKIFTRLALIENNEPSAIGAAGNRGSPSRRRS